MPQQLNDLLAGVAANNMQAIGLLPFIFLMAVSLVGALLSSLLYVQFYSSRATGSQVHRAFPLLGLSITAIFVCIQFSLPLSLGLLGALSIVRFRTPIKEPEEIGFIMLVIATSIATATFKLQFVGIIFGLAFVALLVQTRGRWFGKERLDGTIVITVPEQGGPADAAALTALVRQQVSRAELESVTRHDGATIVSYVFQGMSHQALNGLQLALPAAETGSTFAVFFSRPGAL
jgi:Domain of unknown function (DUF4956)